MQTQQIRLFRELDGYGWQRVEDGLAEQTPDWWMDEVWVLESLWAPRSCRVYLTFVVDPQWDKPRATGQGVWAVTGALEKPAQWSDVQLPLGRGWEKELPAFFEGLARLRVQWQQESEQAAQHPLHPTPPYE